MKIAICFYGIPRFYDKFFEYNKFYDNCDVDYYLHCWGDEDIKLDLIKHFNPKSYIIEPQVDVSRSFEYSIDTSCITKSVFDTLSPLYSMQQVHNQIVKIEDDYDFWILTRTDIGMVSKIGNLEKLLVDRDKLYLSYISGNDAFNSWIGTQFVAGTKNDILNLTNIYSNLDIYLRDKQIPLCHHRLYYNALSYKKENFSVLNLDDDHIYKGWYWVRNGELSDI